MKKVVLDQVFLTLPILFIFFTAMSYWEGKQDITAEFREKIVKTYAVTILFYVYWWILQNTELLLHMRSLINFKGKSCDL